MSIINVLDKHTANLIAAGEVVDRPASVAKELLENAIDAGAKSITLEIRHGGSSMIRITDDGKGMSPDDVRLSVLRHATSKIKDPKDLDGIRTLGFRGEALAAISSVSRFQIISKTPGEEFGVSMMMEGEKEVSFEEIGCPDGTTVVVRDIFFNTPARRKFLKKDQTETAYIAQYIERIAISHPHIAFKFISDSKVRFSTSGNGDLKSAIYAVFGREFVNSLLEVDNTYEKIRVHGFISYPDKSRVNRNFQMFFINNRFVRTRSTVFALEDAYKTYIMIERYPACVLFVDLEPYLVDVNVHPSKLEVRFVDENEVRQAVYFTVRDAIESIKNPIGEDISEKIQEDVREISLLNFTPVKTDVKKEQITFSPSFLSSDKPKTVPDKKEEEFEFLFKAAPPAVTSSSSDFVFMQPQKSVEIPEKYSGTIQTEEKSEEKNEDIPTESLADKVKNELYYCGTVFDTYIIAEFDSNMYIIDKHAAHERMLYEALKRKKDVGGVQMLIDSITVTLTSEECDAALSSKEEIESVGFEFDEVGPNTVAVRGVPTEFSGLTSALLEQIFVGMISDILLGRKAKNTRDDYFDKALFTAACRAAVKGGIPDSEQSYRYLLKQISELDNIFCCPHGRPIIVKYTKSQIEKMFFRT